MGTWFYIKAAGVLVLLIFGGFIMYHEVMDRTYPYGRPKRKRFGGKRGEREKNRGRKP
jgi:hypothetical protein